MKRRDFVATSIVGAVAMGANRAVVDGPVEFEKLSTKVQVLSWSPYDSDVDGSSLLVKNDEGPFVTKSLFRPNCPEWVQIRTGRDDEYQVMGVRRMLSNLHPHTVVSSYWPEPRELPAFELLSMQRLGGEFPDEIQLTAQTSRYMSKPEPDLYDPILHDKAFLGEGLERLSVFVPQAGTLVSVLHDGTTDARWYAHVKATKTDLVDGLGIPVYRSESIKKIPYAQFMEETAQSRR